MTSTKRPITQRAEDAIHHLQEADTLKTRRPLNPFEHTWNPLEAERLRMKGEALLAAPSAFDGDSSLEVLPALEPGETVTNAHFYLRDTLQEPDVISVDASTHRAHLALKAGVLTNALDAAKSAGVTSPIEKMLCHQMAGVHEAGMGLLIRLNDAVTTFPQTLLPGDMARLTNAASRLFDVFQNGALVLQKLKTGGTQRVVVQHQQLVQVGDGGQAVVAKTVRRGSRRRGRSDGQKAR